MTANTSLQNELVVVLDFGAQYSQLIARRVREAHVYCEIWPCDTPLAKFQARAPRGIIFSGGPSSVYAPGAPQCDPALFTSGIPILGICYGLQYMASVLGGEVQRAQTREYGKTNLFLDDPGDLLVGLTPENPDGSLVTWMSHGDLVLAPPPGFKILAHTPDTPVAAMGDPRRRLYGVQFHPEVAHTPQGAKVIANFLTRICGCRGDWTMASFIEQETQAIRARVGAEKVICALSGGVDSSVAAALVHRAVGEQLTCIFVNHGLLRKGEAEEVTRTFRENLGLRLVYVDASVRFLGRLAGVTDPERKRKLIGEEFIRVFEEEARRLGESRFLVQGTLYPDVIESGNGQAATIKSHHNVGGLPEDMQFELLEPLRELFKDEVRLLGRELGLPEQIVQRQPFPGPGLAIRIMGAVTPEKLALLREADAIVREEIEGAGLGREVWQFFAVLTNTQTVGVMGDERTYDHVVAVRAVTSTDGMTADWARLPYDVLARISSRIINEIPGVNRVVYDISSKPPGTIEWE